MSLLPKLLRLNYRGTTSLSRLCLTRQFKQSTVSLKSEKICEVVAPGFQKLKKEQKRYQVDNALPIHLKLGSSDKMLYQLTLVSLTICIIYSLYVLVMCVLKRG